MSINIREEFPMNDIESIYQKLTNVDIRQQQLLWDERGKGYYGEFLVFSELYPNLPGECKILMNINIPTAYGKTTEIDLLLIHETGLYVFEMKHYKGTIYGKPYEQYWTQYFRTAPNQRFRSPIAQNQYHINALSKIAPGVPIHSFVVFTSDEVELKVDCNEPNITLCTLSHLRYHLSNLTYKPNVLSMAQINQLFCTLLQYSPTSQQVVEVNGKEIPFYGFVSEIISAYKTKKAQLEIDSRNKTEIERLNYEFEKNRTRKARKFSIIGAILAALACIGLSIAACMTAYKDSTAKIAAAQQELAAFAQKFEEVKPFNNGELDISKDLVTASNVVIDSSPDLENTVSFACTLNWNGSDYGVNIGEKAVIIVILNDGTIKECPVFNEQYPYSTDCRLGKSNAWYSARSKADILPHEFYDIAISDIAYIKLSNVDLWLSIEYKPSIVASGYEIELYRAE